MNDALERLRNCTLAVRRETSFLPEAAIVLGSGLGGLAEQLSAEAIIPYEQIPGFPISTVPGHKGRFLFGYLEQVPVVLMQGRVHYYEGYSMEEVVLPIRLMKQLGAGTVFLTNAAGGVNPSYRAGDFMLLRDHIASFVPSCLRGPNVEEWGPRFPDMSQIYDPVLCQLVRQAAKELDICLQEGVYCQLSGPSYETPAEVRLCGRLGADAVGMSTACEAVAAHHMGMKVCGISCISNPASGLTDAKLSHTEVQETADRVAPLFQRLLRNTLAGWRRWQETRALENGSYGG